MEQPPLLELQEISDREPLDPFWQHGAPCGVEPEVFFPEIGENDKVERAKRLCGACSVRATCLKVAINAGEEYGVWGGLTDYERALAAADAPTKVALRLADEPLLLERALYVLSGNAGSLLRSMVHDQDSGELLDARAIPIAARDAIRRAEASEDIRARRSSRVARRHIVESGTALLEGRFDYRHWVKYFPQQCPKSALSLLARMEEPIPDVPLACLNALARAALLRLPAPPSRQPDAQDTLHQAIQQLYGLTGPPGEIDEVSQKLGMRTRQLETLMTKTFRLYHQNKAA